MGPLRRKDFVDTLDDRAESWRKLSREQGLLRRQTTGTVVLGILVGMAVTHLVSLLPIPADAIARQVLDRHPVVTTLAAIGCATSFLLLANRKESVQPIRNHLRSIFGDGPFEMAVEIHEAFLGIFIDEMEVHLPWKTVTRLRLEGDALEVWVSAKHLVVLPGRVFEAESERMDWIRLIEQKTGLSFS